MKRETEERDREVVFEKVEAIYQANPWPIGISKLTGEYGLVSLVERYRMVQVDWFITWRTN